MSKSHEIYKQSHRHLSPLRHESTFKGLHRDCGWKSEGSYLESRNVMYSPQGHRVD